MSFYPLERAADVLAAYRDWAPDRAGGPEHGGPADAAAARRRLPRAPPRPPGAGDPGVRAHVDEASGRRWLRPRCSTPPVRRSWTRSPCGPSRGERRHQRAGRPADAAPAAGAPLRRPRTTSCSTRWSRRDSRPTRPSCSSRSVTGAGRWRDRARRRAGGAPPTPYSVLAVAPYLDPDRAAVDARRRPARRRARAPGHRRVVPEPAHRPGPDRDGVHARELPASAPDQEAVGPRRRVPPLPPHPAGSRPAIHERQ